MGLWVQIKQSYKNQNETIHAGKEENEEISKSMTKISTRPDIFATRDYSDDCVTSIWVFTSLTSCLFSLDIFNSKPNRYPEDALYARNGSRSCKNIARGRERFHLKNAVAVWKGRWLSTEARSRKISEEHQNYLASNIHLEVELSDSLLRSFNGKWQGFSMFCSESELRLVELFTFRG